MGEVISEFGPVSFTIDRSPLGGWGRWRSAADHGVKEGQEGNTWPSPTLAKTVVRQRKETERTGTRRKWEKAS